MTEIAVQTKTFDLSPQTFEQALVFAGYLADSQMVPKDFMGKPGNCLVAIQWGMELGLKPLQCMQNIAVINGRPSLWGDAVMALVLASPSCKDVIERYEGTGDNYAAVCIAQRHGKADKEARFSLLDAKAAGLLGKSGPWTQYRDRMMKMRARAFALRDQFADVLKGMAVAEEAMDTEEGHELKHMGAAEVVKPATWPDDLFEQRLPEWRKAIAGKRATADGVIAKAKTKYPLSDAQEKAIRAPIEPTGTTTPAPDVTDAWPVVTYAQVAERLHKAVNADQLADAGDLIGAVADPGQRAELSKLFDTRTTALTT